MAWELGRRRLVRTITTTYLFGRLPLINLLVMVFHLALLSRLATRYNAYYADRPVVTMMVTNAILYGVADTVAQTISAVRSPPAPAPAPGSAKQRAEDPIALGPAAAAARDSKAKSDFLISAVDVDDSDEPGPPGLRHLRHRPGFDFERLSRFAAYGFAVAPLQYRWFGLLNRVFPMTKGGPALAQALKRVLLDQLVFAPFGLTLFFAVMTVAEGGGRRAIANKMRDMFVPTLKANYILWPAVQMVNFRLMPVQFQLPFVSSVGIAWTAYLSLANAAEDEARPIGAAAHSAARFREA